MGKNITLSKDFPRVGSFVGFSCALLRATVNRANRLSASRRFWGNQTWSRRTSRRQSASVDKHMGLNKGGGESGAAISQFMKNVKNRSKFHELTIFRNSCYVVIFIRPESDHWLPLSLTNKTGSPSDLKKSDGRTKGLKRAFLSLTAIFSARNGSKL